MKRRDVISALAAAAALLLLGGLWVQNASLREQVNTLQGTLDRVETVARNTQISLSGLKDELRTELERQGSLFSRVESHLSFENEKLKLSVTVLPKEVREGELLTLTAGTGTTALSIGSDGSYSGVLTLPLAEEIAPTITFRSAAGVRQEALEVLYSRDVLHVTGLSSEVRQDSRIQLYVGLTCDPYGPVSAPEDVSSLLLRVTDAAGTELGAVPLYACPPPPEEHSSSSAARPDIPSDGSILWYSADVSSYLQGKSYELQFWAELIVSGGLTLTDSTPAVTLSQNGSQSSASFGGLDLYPGSGRTG